MNKADKQATQTNAQLHEELLWGAPARSDAEFVVSLQSKLTQRSTGLWLLPKQVAWAGSLAVVLIVGLWLPVSTSNSDIDTKAFVEIEADSTYEAPLDLSRMDDGLEDSHELKEAVEDLGTTYVESDPSAGELLELEPEEIELVLNELEETHFF